MTPEEAADVIIARVFNSLDMHCEPKNEVAGIIQDQRAAAVAEATAWQPIETAPKDGSSFIGGQWDSNGFWDNVEDACWNKKGGFFTGSDWTHWQPLQNPPVTLTHNNLL
jgi:hypothetical protein